MNYLGVIFDLDGVLVDTAKYHYLAWKELALQLQIPFTKSDNEQLKGISREESLEKLLAGDTQRRKFSDIEKEKFLICKNEKYIEYIEQLTAGDLLPGAEKSLKELKLWDVGIALGSASKNAKTILNNTGIIKAFDVIVDGTSVTRSKPDPEVFLLAAEKLGKSPERCIVVEDSQAGIKAALNAGMKTIGIGRKDILKEADWIFKDLSEVKWQTIFSFIYNSLSLGILPCNIYENIIHQ